MPNNAIETILGAVVLVATGGFLVFALSTADLKKVDGYEVSATFSQATGISPGADVRISGVKVGSVTDLALDDITYLAKISMSIKPNIELPKDTVAKIATEGLFGGKYMSLEPGGSEELLADGGIIYYTQGSVNLEELIGKFIFSDGEARASTTASAGSMDVNY